jgi:hypothetical protein
MPSTAATTISKVSGAFLSEDGQYMAFRLIGDEGEEINLAIPPSELHSLVSLCSRGIIESKKGDQVMCIKTEAWSLGFAAPLGQVVLSLTFDGGALLSFGLDQDMAKGILDTLQSRLDATRPHP